VRAQTGLTLGEFDRETQAFGLATTLGTVSTTGIAGLTLGAGWGHLHAKHGLALDNVVTADGRLLTANAHENEIGTKMLVGKPGSKPPKPGRTTPTIVSGYLLTRILRPIIWRSPPKRFIQYE
jgi:FAD/FMN-containing dehydrogenase